VRLTEPAAASRAVQVAVQYALCTVFLHPLTHLARTQYDLVVHYLRLYLAPIGRSRATSLPCIDSAALRLDSPSPHLDALTRRLRLGSRWIFGNLQRDRLSNRLNSATTHECSRHISPSQVATSPAWRRAYWLLSERHDARSAFRELGCAAPPGCSRCKWNIL
jgi:hypothetical protein